MAKKLVNIGVAGEEVEKGIFKTVYMARNGIFEEKNSWMGRHLYKASDYVFNGSSSIPEIEAELELTQSLPRLPFEAFSAAYRFYKEVCDLNGLEAQINFYVNDKNLDIINVDGEAMILRDIPGIHFWSEQVFSYVPIQKNSSALTEAIDPIYDVIRRVTKPYIETHSHNTMSAFKSGTDAANSLNEGLQLVFGKLNSDVTYDFKSWVTVGGSQADDLTYEELSTLIDLPENIGVVEELANVEIPQEWFDQCIFSSSRKVQTYTYNGFSESYMDKYAKYEEFGIDYEDTNAIDDYTGANWDNPWATNKNNKMREKYNSFDKFNVSEIRSNSGSPSSHPTKKKEEEEKRANEGGKEDKSHTQYRGFFSRHLFFWQK